MRFLKTAVLLGAIGLLTASVAHAADEEAGSAKDKIRKQMERIRTLMQDNENALLDLSVGTKAKTKRVDVDVPNPPGTSGEGEGTNGEGTNGGGGSGESGESAGKAIDELLRKQSESGEPIPEELTRLVKMIPL